MNKTGYDIPDDSPLVQLAVGTTSPYQTRVVRQGEKTWSPLVLLPRRVTNIFCGRDKEYGELREWFNDTSSRACLVFGEGGIGKTTLVLEFLNDILDGIETGVTWQPELICFYSAKQTRWTSGGIERIHGVFPAVSEAIRDLIRVYEDHPGKDWYADARALIGKAEDMFRGLGVPKENVLLVLDNTETLAARRDEEATVSKLLASLKKICRVLLTSRRHEKVEAYPLQIPSMSEVDGAILLSRLGEALKATPILQAGDAKRRKLSRSLGGRPILLEVLVRYAAHGGHSLDTALELVHRDAQRDLGEFLFQDAWDRIGDDDRTVFLLLLLSGAFADETLLGWVCAKVGVASTVWLDAFEETRFGALRDYGTHFDVTLDPAAEDFLGSQLERQTQARRQELERMADELKKRYRKLVSADELRADDRIAKAFASAPAKLAKLAGARGDNDDAEKWFEEAVRVDGSNAALWDRFAWFLCIRSRNMPRAKACAAQAIKLAPNDPDAHFTAGMVAGRMGDIGAADLHLNRAMELGRARHLCLAQQARARVSRFESEKDESLGLLHDAQNLLREAESISPRGALDYKHLRECRRTRKRITQMFSETRGRMDAR